MRRDIHAYFRTLGLNPGVGPTEIRRAYRQLMQRWHPDLYKSGSPMQTTAEDMAKEINEAYDQLYRKKLYRKFLPKAERQQDAASSRSEESETTRDEGVQTAPEKDKPSRPASPGPRARFSRDAWGRRLARLSWVKLGAAAAVVAAAAVAVPAYRWLAPTTAGTPVTATAGAESRSPRAPESKERDAARDLGPAAAAPTAATPDRRESAALRSAHIGEHASATGAVRIDDAPAQDRSLEVGRSAGIPDAPDHPGAPRMPDASYAAGPEPSASGFTLPAAMATAAIERRLAEISAHRERLFEEAESLLRVIDVGDTKARVIEIQGKPDDAAEHVFRYGSSLVYFIDGRVSGWFDRAPRLHIRIWPTFKASLFDSFASGSSRADVVRAQGTPDRFTGRAYFYGTSVVTFRDDRVDGWEEGDVPLRRFVVPILPFPDLDRYAYR